MVTAADYAVQRVAMGSVGAGTVSFASFITDAMAGVALHNFFVIGHNSATWGSHMPAANGGGVFASWLWCCRFWRAHLLGGQIVSDLSVRSGTMDMPGAPDVDPVIVAAVDNGDRRYILVFNLDISSRHTVRILTDGIAGRSCTRHYMATPNAAPGEEYRAHNTTPETAGDIYLAFEPHAFTLPLQVTIPPGMVEVFEFE